MLYIIYTIAQFKFGHLNLKIQNVFRTTDLAVWASIGVTCWEINPPQVKFYINKILKVI